MTTAYTSLLGLALPTTGELTGTWGDTVNNYITQYLDSAIAGAQVISANTDVTLSKTEGIALNSSSSQYAVLRLEGARSQQRTVTVALGLAAAARPYIVVNLTTGGFATVIKTDGVGSTGVSIVSGEVALIVWNGTDFAKYTLPDNSITTAKLVDGSVNADKLASGAAVANIGFTPLQQGGGTGQGTNKVYVGWTGSSKLGLQVDATNFGTTWPVDISGNATTATSAVNATNATNATYATTSGSTNSVGAFVANTPGYQKLPSGIMIQWGSTTLTYGGVNNNGFYRLTGSATFPLAFNGVFAVTASPVNAGTGFYGASVTVSGITTTTASFIGNADYGSSGSMGIHYIAIGSY